MIWASLPACQVGFPLTVIAEIVAEDVAGIARWFAGGMKQMQAGFGEGTTAFVMVAGGAGGHNIGPGFPSAEAARDDMIDG